jgi:hypothetical protein
MKLKIVRKISFLSLLFNLILRALKSNSAPSRGSAWEACIVGPTQRRKEVARRERAKSREEGKGGW